MYNWEAGYSLILFFKSSGTYCIETHSENCLIENFYICQNKEDLERFDNQIFLKSTQVHNSLEIYCAPLYYHYYCYYCYDNNDSFHYCYYDTFLYYNLQLCILYAS